MATSWQPSCMTWQRLSFLLQCNSRAWSPWLPRRHGSSWKKRVLKREDIKEQVTQYVGENARRADRVYVWGCASTGALGIKSYMRPEKKKHIPITEQPRPARLRFMDVQNFKVYSVATGYGFSVFAVKAPHGHQVYGCGINTDSQLGFHEMPRGSGRILDYIIEPAGIELPLLHRDTTRVQQVSAGRAHTLLLTDKEGVLSLGNNAYGQCGRTVIEGEIYSHNPTVNRIKNLPENISKVVCGQDHSFFLTEEGELYSCGLGADGQTGLETYDVVERPTLVKGDIKGVKIVDVSSKGDCVLAVSEDGEVFGWGNSEYSQLSMVTDQTQVNIPKHINLAGYGKVIRSAAAGSKCAVLNDTGQVYVWGFGILGKGPKLDSSILPSQIPPPLFGQNELQPDTKVVDIACGLHHFVALTDMGDVYSWGRNKSGCLGLGSHNDQFFPLKVALPAEAHHISCGVDHTVVLCKSFC